MVSGEEEKADLEDSGHQKLCPRVENLTYRQLEVASSAEMKREHTVGPGRWRLRIGIPGA